MVPHSIDKEERQIQDGKEEGYLLVKVTDSRPENLGPNPDCRLLLFPILTTTTN